MAKVFENIRDNTGIGDFADTGEVRYEYDGYGRRITKDYAGGSTNDVDFYFNENYQVVEVRKNNDTDAAQRFLWDVIYIDAPAMVELDTNTDGTRDFRLWPTFDGNFNVTSLVTDQGKVVERYAYTPYGQRILRCAAVHDVDVATYRKDVRKGYAPHFCIPAD